MENTYKNKYLKYKNKYLYLKKKIGGNKTNIGVYIGRFQPAHIVHLNIIKKGIQNEDKFLLIIGSIDKSSSKNPFTFEQRKEFILGALTEEEKKKITIVGLRDSTPEEDRTEPLWWYKQIEKFIDQIKDKDKEYNVYLYGGEKDDASEYLKQIKTHSGITDTKTIDVVKILMDGKEVDVNATIIRTLLNKEQKTPDDIKYLKTVLPLNLQKYFSIV